MSYAAEFVQVTKAFGAGAAGVAGATADPGAVGPGDVADGPGASGGDKICVLEDASASFEAGCVHLVEGPSGAGKTTVLRLLMGLEKPDAGRVELPGSPRLAAAFQEDRLCANLTATANIRIPHGRLRGAELEAFLGRERAALLAVGLPVDARPVREYSGGQRRRIALLRAVLADADIVFFDEPLKGMDEATVGRVMAFIVPELAGRTVFWVTHDASDARFFDPELTRRWQVGDGRIARARM